MWSRRTGWPRLLLGYGRLHEQLDKALRPILAKALEAN
jgi:hypothetical protein